MDGIVGDFIDCSAVLKSIEGFMLWILEIDVKGAK